jgi:cell division septation protein DedD
VSVGAFGSPENAARQAQLFRDAGYPVFEGVQGNLTIVLVGPYADEAVAESVRARIAAGGFGIEPVVYRFRPDAPTPGASTPNPGAAGQAAAPVSTPTASTVTITPATAAATPGTRSLQVGAFADAQSAAPLRDRLGALGLASFELREDGLIKLLVGPFEGERLAEVRVQLSELGIESFPR